ncbi:MFS transporter [Yoonia sp. I 8.24]|uniref:MFS transporter n=1 Tax=Yoonia sp. I 8.24 TaxID=1537229 RepID=UPI001EDF6591|nr:MFS transporter [Yoonia sp. I 8.24]
MTIRTTTDKRNNTKTDLLGPSFSIILASLGTSAAAVTLPELPGEFQGVSLDTTFVVSAYILATTALIVPVGRAGDLFGKRTVLIVGLSLFILGAFLAFHAPTLPILVASRFIQGAGAAAMMAMPLAQVRDVVTSNQIGRWMGAMGTMSAIGTASGPALGGAIIAGFGWRAVYLLQIPAAVIALGLCLFYVTDNKRTDTRAKIDVAGAGALAVFIASFTVFISDLASGFGALTAVFLAVAIIAVAGFWVIEHRTTVPILPLELLRSPRLRLSLAMNAIVSLVMMGILVVGPFFLTGGLGLTTAQMGLAMSVGPIASALSGIPAGRLTERIGSGRAVIVGGLAVTMATAGMAGLPYVFGVGGFIAAFMLLSPSYQVFLAALNTSVMEGAPNKDRGVTSGILNLSRNFGFILGASAISGVFWSLVNFGTGDETEAVSLAMAGTFALCSALALCVVLLAMLAKRHPDIEDVL